MIDDKQKLAETVQAILLDAATRINDAMLGPDTIGYIEVQPGEKPTETYLRFSLKDKPSRLFEVRFKEVR